MKKFLVPFVLFLLVIVTGVYFAFFYGKNSPRPEYIMCPADAKICPDGSAVGRIPPKCEFAACPATLSSTTKSAIKDTQNGRYLGYIEELRQDDISVRVKVKPIEMYSGEEATKIAMQDTGCTKETIITCAPSLNNGFYIRKNNMQVPLVLTPATSIFLSSETDMTVTKKVNMEELLRRYSDYPTERWEGLPFWLTVKNGKIEKIEEQYIP